jgi:hypothetical protein
VPPGSKSAELDPNPNFKKMFITIMCAPNQLKGQLQAEVNLGQFTSG